MTGISTHVLDLASGQPAEGVAVRLDRHDGEAWQSVASGATNADGRLPDLLVHGPALVPGLWRLHFELAPYFRAHGGDGFFPEATLTFDVRDAARHHHVPLLLSPYGYTTYRGS